MLFSSLSFLFFFLPAVILLDRLLPKKAEKVLLFLSSVFFYAWGEQKLVILFLGSILSGWVSGLLIEKNRGKKTGKIFLFLSLFFPLFLLGLFKYTDFFLSSVNSLFRTNLPLPSFALPIGISFYSFQILSYSVDVWRGEVNAEKDPIRFAAYVSFFPQLIAGPIVRYSLLAPQFSEKKTTAEETALGLRRFLAGLGKKVLFANLLGEIGEKYLLSDEKTVVFTWLFALSFSLQIYFDFSGYSDMAIGLGHLFGFTLPENFDYPYLSKSVTEFWRRWHMTLGGWFRDYVYIPLGGNRRGILRQIINILTVWILTGLWHGAAWNFVLWGLYFALLLIAEKLFLRKKLEKHPILSHVYLLLAVLISFVFFSAESLPEIGKMLLALFGFGGIPFTSVETTFLLQSNAILLLLAILGTTPLPRSLYRKISGKKAMNQFLTAAEPIVLSGLLLTVTAFLIDGSFNPFLYFRF